MTGASPGAPPRHPDREGWCGMPEAQGGGMATPPAHAASGTRAAPGSPAVPGSPAAPGNLPRPLTLVLDNARYQRCELVKSLARSLRIELLFLPSYSPNLNLIERLWRFVKKECLASRPLLDYETFTQTIDECLNSLHTKYKDQMATLLTPNFQTYEDEPVLAA